MFNITDVRELVRSCLEARLNQRAIQEDYVILEYALDQFKKAWTSPDCERYLESFGKLSGMVPREKMPDLSKSEREMYSKNHSAVVEHGRTIKTHAMTKQGLDSPELLIALSGLYNALELMKLYEGEIDAACRLQKVTQ